MVDNVTTIKTLSKQHLTAYECRLKDRIRDLQKELEQDQGLLDEVLKLKAERLKGVHVDWAAE